jgi:hypothetical protein
MFRKLIAKLANHEKQARRCITTRSARRRLSCKLRTLSVDKIVSKELRTIASACSRREKLPSSKMGQDFRFPSVSTFPQFHTYFVDKIVSKPLAQTQSL